MHLDRYELQLFVQQRLRQLYDEVLELVVQELLQVGEKDLRYAMLGRLRGLYASYRMLPIGGLFSGSFERALNVTLRNRANANEIDGLNRRAMSSLSIGAPMRLSMVSVSLGSPGPRLQTPRSVPRRAPQ